MPLSLTPDLPTKLFPNLLEAVVECLIDIFVYHRKAEKTVEQKLKSNRKWGARDRAFIAQTVYDIVRWYRTLCEVSGFTPSEEAQWWKLLGVYCLLKNAALPFDARFAGLDGEKLRNRFQQLDPTNTAIIESLPDWLNEIGLRQLHTQWPAVMAALNTQTHSVLRVNALKASLLNIKKILKEKGCDVEEVGGCEHALLLRNKKNLLITEEYKNGLFEFQDAASQHIAPFLKPEPGMRVIDACAGAGGKTLHLAALMHNKGEITAFDIYPAKLEELKKRAQRAGVSIIKPLLVSEEIIKKYEHYADRVLIDAPCSGLGVLRRHPATKWTLTQDFLQKITALQAALLDEYSTFCKLGGYMVYATCSILPCENNEQVDAFLKRHPNFTLLSERTLLPHISGFDGFYMALLKRTA